ncbi:hypothetical protein, partial [Pseudomonas sp. PDM16]|uniref:hypothetical protein n=1 Tax=Pseudomonas sp. PDM16 TaxID=2769292 RepID=UPI001CE0AB34
MAQQSHALFKELKLSNSRVLLALLIISRLSVLHHKHPHELLDSVVKERFGEVFRLNRGRAFYSSLSTCQAVFEEFFVSSQPLALRIRTSSRQREAHSTAIKTTVNHLFKPPSIRADRSANKTNPAPCQPGAFYSNSPP